MPERTLLIRGVVDALEELALELFPRLSHQPAERLVDVDRAARCVDRRDAAGQQALANARLAEDQGRRVGRRDPRNGLADGLQVGSDCSHNRSAIYAKVACDLHGSCR